MLTVTIVSRKGGSGKTTLAQMLASAMLDRGGKVHMFDGDTDQQVLEWQAKSDAADWNGADRAPWPTTLTMAPLPATIEELYAQANQLEDAGVDLIVIDTQPGAHEGTEDLVLIADIVLVPAIPTQSDFVMAARTIEWVEAIISTVASDQPAPIYRSVMMNASKKAIDVVVATTDAEKTRAKQKIHKQDLEVFDFLKTLPMLPTPISNSDTFRRMPLSGPLTVARDTYKSVNPMSASYAKVGLQICEQLLGDIEKVVEQANA